MVMMAAWMAVLAPLICDRHGLLWFPVGFANARHESHYSNRITNLIGAHDLCGVLLTAAVPMNNAAYLESSPVNSAIRAHTQANSTLVVISMLVMLVPDRLTSPVQLAAKRFIPVLDKFNCGRVILPAEGIPRA